MIKFPSIEQFRSVIHHVKDQFSYAGKDEEGNIIRDHSRSLPTLRFEGTVKLHGTNAGIVYDLAEDTFKYQSRERELTLVQDNAGFMLAMMGKENAIRVMIESTVAQYALGDQLVIFGEWCGGSIQKGVAISGLPKMFVIFGAKVLRVGEEVSEWIEFRHSSEENGIYNIQDFSTYYIDIDFRNPELAQNLMIEITEEVEAECPVGKHFGNSGVGEGIVWRCITPGWSDLRFKVKGEKHSVSKVKTLAAVDVEAIENIREFVDNTVTEARLEQGLQNLVNEQLLPLEMASVGPFIRWVYNDIIKEETDTIVASQLEVKKLGSAIANKARPWFMKKIA